MPFSAEALRRRAEGTDHAQGPPMSTRLQSYETAEIAVTFNPSICAHSGVGVRGLPSVFDV